MNYNKPIERCERVESDIKGTPLNIHEICPNTLKCLDYLRGIQTSVNASYDEYVTSPLHCSTNKEELTLTDE